MSKYLIKPVASIYLDPIGGLHQLKRDLLLYDRLGMLNLHSLLGGLKEYNKYPFYRDALNEVEYLIQNNKFVDLKTLVKPGDVLMDENDLELSNITMELKKEMDETSNKKDEKKHFELFWKHDELNTRLWCNIANATNEAIHAVPALRDTSTFELPKTTKEKAYTIVYNLIPTPVDNTPWEKIFDFNEDTESKRKLLGLRNWINELPSDIKQTELEDKINYLLQEYEASLKRHKISYRLSTFKTIVNAIPTALSEIVRLRFNKAVDAFFVIAEQEVNFTKYKEREELPGHELAFISHVNNFIGQKKGNR
jgi:hypothetical protein